MKNYITKITRLELIFRDATECLLNKVKEKL